MSSFSSQPIVIDGKGHLLGRLASIVSKQVSQIYRVVISSELQGGLDGGLEKIVGVIWGHESVRTGELACSHRYPRRGQPVRKECTSRIQDLKVEIRETEDLALETWTPYGTEC